MSGEADLDPAIAQAARRRVDSAIGLTAEGRQYVERFARYLLKVNGTTRMDLAPTGAKRPKCAWPLTLGRRLRETTATAVRDELQSRDRRLKLPDDLVL